MKEFTNTKVEEGVSYTVAQPKGQQQQKLSAQQLSKERLSQVGSGLLHQAVIPGSVTTVGALVVISLTEMAQFIPPESELNWHGR